MDWILKQSFNHFLKSFCEPLQEDGLQLSFVDGLVVKDLIIRPSAINDLLSAHETDMRVVGGRIGTLRMCYTAVPGVVTMQMSDLDIRIKPNALTTISRTICNKLTDLVTGIPEDPAPAITDNYEGGWLHPPSQTYYHHLPQNTQPMIATNYIGQPSGQPMYLHPHHPLMMPSQPPMLLDRPYEGRVATPNSPAVLDKVHRHGRHHSYSPPHYTFPTTCETSMPPPPLPPPRMRPQVAQFNARLRPTPIPAYIPQYQNCHMAPQAWSPATQCKHTGHGEHSQQQLEDDSHPTRWNAGLRHH